MTTAAERVVAAREVAPTEVVPDQTPNVKLVGSCDIANHYHISVDKVTVAAKKGAIPGAFLFERRWVFDFDVAIAGWKPPELVYEEQGLPDPREGRLPDGRFKKGYVQPSGKLGGRPPRQRERRYMDIMNANVSEEDWAGIIRKAIEQALAGGARARTWLSNYLLGKPVERILAKVEVGAERFSVAERATAIEEMLSLISGEIIEGSATEVKDATET